MEKNGFLAKISLIGDWVYKLFMINLLVIFSAVGVITLYSGLLAGFKLFHDYINHDETSIFKGFFKYFKENIRRKLFIGFALVALVIISYFNFQYYNSEITNNPNWFIWLGLIVTIILVVTVMTFLLFSLPVMMLYPKAELGILFKLTAYLVGKYFFRTLLIVIFWALPFGLLFTPFTLFIFILAGISLPLLFQAFVSQKIIIYMLDFGKKEKNE